MGAIILVGECNPYSTDPTNALLPWPGQAAGNRLRMILGMSEEDYLAAFDRANLYLTRRPGTNRQGTERASALLELGHPLVVALGRTVAHAFGRALELDAPAAFGHVVFDVGRRLCALPHPSGRCREWNVPGSRERARALLGRA